MMRSVSGILSLAALAAFSCLPAMAQIPGGGGSSGTTGYAQGSTTSGQLGPLDQTATTTSNPTYSTGTTNPFSTDTSGGLRVNCITGCGGSGGTAQADKSAFTEGSTELTPIGGEYVSGGAGNCTTGDACAAQITIDRMLYVNIGKVGGAVTGTAGSAGTGVLTVQGIASMTPIIATGSGTAGSAATGVLTVQGIASMTKLLVTPDSVALPANQSVNVSQINGVTPLMGNGTTGTGSQRVTIASDNTAFSVNATLQASATTAIGKVDPNTAANWGIGATAAAVPANGVYNGINVAGNLRGATGVNPTGTVYAQQMDMASVGGTSVALGSTTGSASIPVVIASNQTAADPCMFQAKTNVAISTASGTTALVTGVSAKKIYVCSFSLIVSGAISVSLSEGSSSTCGTSSQAAVLGVATNGTAANGIALPANGGLTLGNGGGTIALTATNANYLCLFQSGTTQMAGNLTYVQQ